MVRGNFFSGTNAGGDTLEVSDGTTINTDVRNIIVSAGTITASSGHTITITTGGGGGGGGTIGGTIADTQVAFGTAADTIGGEAELTYVDTAGSRKFTVSDSDAGTTTVLYPLKVSRISTGTAALGLGVGLEFEAEAPAQPGVNVVGSIIESISTAGTNAANTRFDLVIKNLNGSADPTLTNEVARFTSNGGFTTTSSLAAGTTVIVDPDAGGTVTVGGTGGVSTTDGPINAGGATGAVTANTTVSAGSTVTAATGVIATTGGVSALGTGTITTLNGAISAGGVTGAISANTTVSAGSTVTAATGVIATTGNIQAVAGSISAIGNESKIASILTPAVPIGNTELLDIALMGKIMSLTGDTYTLGTGILDAGTLGFTATFLPLFGAVTVAIGGAACDGVIAGGAVSPVGFTCPQYEPFTISFIGDLQNIAAGSGLTKVLQVYGNATAL